MLGSNFICKIFFKMSCNKICNCNGKAASWYEEISFDNIKLSLVQNYNGQVDCVVGLIWEGLHVLRNHSKSLGQSATADISGENIQIQIESNDLPLLVKNLFEKYY